MYRVTLIVENGSWVMAAYASLFGLKCVLNQMIFECHIPLVLSTTDHEKATKMLDCLQTK